MARPTVFLDRCPICEEPISSEDGRGLLASHLETSEECRRRGRELVEERVARVRASDTRLSVDRRRLS